MIPGLGGMNPAKMKGLMKQLGVSQEEIDAARVIIEKNDGGKIVIEPANVQKVGMQGQVSWQVSGDAREESGELQIDDGDVELVMQKTGKSKEEVRKVLEETKDVAEAIVRLS